MYLNEPGYLVKSHLFLTGNTNSPRTFSVARELGSVWAGVSATSSPPPRRRREVLSDSGEGSQSMGDIGLREMRDVFTLGPGAYVTDETRTFQITGRAGMGEESSVPMAPGPVLSSVTPVGQRAGSAGLLVGVGRALTVEAWRDMLRSLNCILGAFGALKISEPGSQVVKTRFEDYSSAAGEGKKGVQN